MLRRFYILAILLVLTLAGQSVAVAQRPAAAPTPSPSPQELIREEIPQISAAMAAPPAHPGEGTIIPAPVLLSYKEAKDNFGRRIADTYIVVQVSIKNPDIAHQFLLQDLMVVLDPNQCRKARDFYDLFDMGHCQQLYNKYIKYPIAFEPVAQPALIAVAGIGQSKNPRNVAIRSLEFLATMAGAMTGFVGSDGKAAIGIFNGTFLGATKSLFPDLSIGQMTRISEQSYRPNTVIESKETKAFDVFIPADQVFSKETWKMYRQDPRNSSADALEMRQIFQLVLTVTASGIHIEKQEDDPGDSVNSGDILLPTRRTRRNR